MLAVILVVAGMGFKIAAVPFHMWAPDVYEGAPTPITGVPLCRLEGGVVRHAAADFHRKPSDDAGVAVREHERRRQPAPDIGWGMMFYVLAVVTMTVGNFAALTQSNLKRMLAYSSIAHAGYLLIGVVAGTARGVTAMLVYLFVYAFMQLGAFAVIVLMRRHDVVGDELKDLNGLFFRQPFAAVAMLLFMLSLGGIPPTAGFMGKFWLFSAAIESGYVWLAVIGVLNSAVSLYYYIRIVVFMMLKNEPAGSEPRQSPAMAVAMGVAVVATLLLGVYPQPLFEFAQASAATLGVSAIAADIALKAGEFRREISDFTLVNFFTRYAIVSMPDDTDFLARSFRYLQENVRRSGPAAAASYTLIGAIILLGGIGYAVDEWRGTSPWFLLGGLLLGSDRGVLRSGEDGLRQPGKDWQG